MTATRRLLVAVASVTLFTGGCSGGGSEGGDATTATTATTHAIVPTGAVFGRIPGIVRDVEPSVVAVLTDGGEGSGVVWRRDGTIVTNHHVIVGATNIEIGFADGKRAPARLVAADPLTDLAVLRTERTGLPAARFAKTLPEVGELAIAMGNPLGFENTVTAGIVSGLHRAIPGSAPASQSLVDLVQTDAPISPGNSGGALVDAEGAVIGINVAFIPPEARAVSIGFAIPSPTVIDVIGQLLEDGSVSHAFFGVRPAALTAQIADRLGVEAGAGVVVLDVVAGGPAAAAGITPGDVIVSVDGERVETVEAFLAELRTRDPGDVIAVELVRGSERVQVRLTLTDRPAPGP